MMHRLEALQILKAKLAAIEEEHNSEFAENEDARERIDAKAEARALAVLDFLQNCKIAHPDSLLRIFRRYLRPRSRRLTPNGHQQQHRRRVSIVASVWR
jgi:hypothetical protein